jgi:hypothetical protein
MMTAIARRFIGSLLLVSQQEQRKTEREDDGQSHDARIQFTHV